MYGKKIIGLGAIETIIKHKNKPYLISYNDLKIYQARNKEEENDLKKGKRWEVHKYGKKNMLFMKSFKLKQDAKKYIKNL